MYNTSSKSSPHIPVPMFSFPVLHSPMSWFHYRYVHVLVQKMAVNADLGFLLAVVAFLSAESTNIQLEVRETGYGGIL